MYVCLCKGLAESDIQQAAERGGAHPESLIAMLGLEDDDCCGRCLERVDELATLAAPSCAQCPLARTRANRLDTQSDLLR